MVFATDNHDAVCGVQDPVGCWASGGGGQIGNRIAGRYGAVVGAVPGVNGALLGGLSRLYMADSGVRVSLSGLYMAPKPEYHEYERCGSAPRTRDIAIWLPYISHLAFRSCPNPPYVSQVVGASETWA